MPSGVLKAVSGVVTGLLKPIYKMLVVRWWCSGHRGGAQVVLFEKK